METKRLKITGHNPANQTIIRIDAEKADRLMGHLNPLELIREDISSTFDECSPFYISVSQCRKLYNYFSDRCDFMEKIEYCL